MYDVLNVGICIGTHLFVKVPRPGPEDRIKSLHNYDVVIIDK